MTVAIDYPDYDWHSSAALADEMRRRIKLLQDVGDDPRKQAIAVEHCRYNLLDWVRNFAWTYDPRRRPALIPFVLFPAQEEYLRWRLERRANGQNGLCEKSRDMGVSWLNVLHQTHCWLFEEGYKGGFGSRKEVYVDNIGDPDSIFEKIRILLRSLPPWMLPKGFSWGIHDCFCKLINPDTGAAITGEAGESIGRGGRTSIYDWDEVAFTPRAHKVDAALSNNTDTVFYTSSANGFNFFYKKRSQYPSDWVFRVHWTEDPRKNRWEARYKNGNIANSGAGRNAPPGAVYPWYESMCAKYDAVTIASEVDCDYGASVEGIYIPAAWVQAAIALDLPRSGPPMAALDVARFGKNKNVLGFREGPVVYGIEDWIGTDTTYTTYKAKERVEQAIAISLAIDADGVGGGCLDTLSNIPELKFVPVPIHGAGSPRDRYWEGEERSSKEKFYNARAERWGLLHQRFKKTYDHVRGVEVHPLDELISIPNHPSLVAQISQPKRRFASNGKTLIESKEDMEKRGLESPDFADMLSQLFALEPHDIPQPGFSFESLGARESIAGLGRGWS